jgi:murein DD-endopeptidase MepM/ murein hydrolase activator NlpD
LATVSRRLLGTLAALAVFALLLTWGWPWLANAVRLARLVREEPPRVLPVPVEGVAPEELEDGWGAPRSGGRRHEGIDIFAPRGTPVVSTTRGVIVRKGWNRLGGWSVNVLGPGGQHHYYAHFDQLGPPEVGDWVEVGEILGFVGDTGNAKGTPTHLHYGIYAWNGEAMDPYPFLVPRGKRLERPGKRQQAPGSTR